MKDFKDSTKTQYSKGGSCYAKGGAVKGAAKVAKVMGEFKAGTLHSGSKKGPEVSNPKQAVAIALSEARKAGAKIPLKRNMGGDVTMDDLNRANRDTGGLDRAGEAAAGRTIARGNRMQAEEAGEAGVMRGKPRSVTVERTTVRAAPVKAEAQSALSRRLNTVPSAADMAKARAAMGKGSFRNLPLVKPVMDALGLKKGGLAVMPKGKGKC